MSEFAVSLLQVALSKAQGGLPEELILSSQLLASSEKTFLFACWRAMMWLSSQKLSCLTAEVLEEWDPRAASTQGTDLGRAGEEWGSNQAGKVQMYFPSATDCHGWEKKLFSSTFHAREIISKLIIY